MTFKELYEISSEIHFDLFDEVDGSLGCLSTGPIVDDGLFEKLTFPWTAIPQIRHKGKTHIFLLFCFVWIL